MYAEISHRIKELRSGRTQKEFADELGISLQGYLRYEYGKRIPPGKVLKKMADIGCVTVDWILSGPEGDANRIKTPPARFGDIRDKIMDMLGDMNEEGRQHIFDHVKATQRLIGDMKKKKVG